MSSDRREGERWTAGQSLKNGALYALVRLAIGALKHLPPRALRAAGSGVGWLAYALFRSARRQAHANLARALEASVPEAIRTRIARECYRRLGRHLGDTIALLGGRPFEPIAIDPDGRDLLERARAKGRGVLFVSAHLGPWERVAGSLVAAGFPLTTLAREAYDPRLTALYDELRGSVGVKVAYRGAPGTASRIVRTLRRGELLGVPMDLRSRVPSVDAAFLGTVAPTAIGPARIALWTRASVIVGTLAPRNKATWAVTMTLIETDDLARDPAGELSLTRRINDELSRRILALPEEWVWMHPRWGPLDGSSRAAPVGVAHRVPAAGA